MATAEGTIVVVDKKQAQDQFLNNGPERDVFWNVPYDDWLRRAEGGRGYDGPRG